MIRLFQALAFSLSLSLCASLQAMTLERVGHDLYATGPTVDQDFLQFKEALAKGGIERLILVNGPGGDLWTGMQVARMVQAAKLPTVVSGYCMSACSLIFMAGPTRAFGTGSLPRATMVGIHGAHERDSKRLLTEVMPEMYALYKQQMGDRFDAQVMNQALYGIREASGFLRIREVQRNLEKDRTPWFCPTAQTPLEQCQQHTGKDAFSLGVVTQTETLPLQLPDSMKVQLGFFGKSLGAPMVDLRDRADSLMEAFCQGQVLCKSIGQRTFHNYLGAHQHKALAIGWGKMGYGVRWGDDDPGTAMLRALYNCNHAKNNPKLCRLVSVNEHEVLPHYVQAQEKASHLLTTLQAPSPGLVQQEREEAGAHTPSRLRTGRQLSGMTPLSLEGIERWDTAQLVRALQQNKRPVVIDAAPFGPVIPAALNLLNSGLAFDEASIERAYAERFERMLRLAAPDLNQALVFYCVSSETWLSVNAAMRARQMGYTQVIWYRGGITAWTQAGLPTVDRTPVAILH